MRLPEIELELVQAAGGDGSTRFTARSAGERVGFAVLLRDGSEVMRLRELWIRPDLIGRNIGWRLLAAAAVEARRSGCLKLLVDPGVPDPDHAVRLLSLLRYAVFPGDADPARMHRGFYVNLYQADTHRPGEVLASELWLAS